MTGNDGKSPSTGKKSASTQPKVGKKSPKLTPTGASSNNVVPLPQTPTPPSIDTSDGALADRFAQENKHRFRHVAAWQKWMLWDGSRWIKDDTQLAQHEAYQFGRKISKEVAREIETGLNAKIDPNDPISFRKAAKAKNARTAVRRAQRYKSLHFRNTVVAMASPNRFTAATVDQWDASDWLLNTPGGCIDLQSAKVKPHDPADYITALSTVSCEDIPTPLWNDFLDTITDGDRDLQQYMQRVFGYCLTGRTTEQALFFGYGTGGNGKSIMLNTIAEVLGDYHKQAAMDTFISTSAHRHLTELARLQGARLVTATETEQGRRWDEQRIKIMTGGEKITAHYMRQDMFEYTPHFKIVIIGNHKPSFKAVDEAIRRRFQLIPFTVTIPKEKRDKNLFDKLRPEWPGILHWLMKGCQMWQVDSLSPPKSVEEATEEYLASEDPVTTWFKSHTVPEEDHWISSKELYDSWKKWSRAADEYTGNVKWLVGQVTNRQEGLGVKYKRKSDGRGFEGVRLVPPDQVRDEEIPV